MEWLNRYIEVVWMSGKNEEDFTRMHKIDIQCGQVIQGIK